MNAIISQVRDPHERDITPHPVGGLTIPINPSRRNQVAFSDEQDIISQREREVISHCKTVISYRQSVEVQFLSLAIQWKRDNLFESSPWRMAAHPAYQRIIGMGPTAVPLILQQLAYETDFWFEALVAITGEQPVPPEHAGDMEAIRRDWLHWGREHGYER